MKRAAASLLAASLLALAPTATAQLPSAPAAPMEAPYKEAPTPRDAAPAGPACQRLLGEGPPSSVCFDPGHRLYLGGAAEGPGWGAQLSWGVQLRHEVRTDDPGTRWRVEQGIARGAYSSERYRGVVYEGRFMRHSREGYLLLPGSPPRRLSVPFDVGLETSVGRLSGKLAEPSVRLNAVRGALLMDFARSETFRYRAALGPVARWDMVADRDRRSITEQAVAPFTVGYLSLYVESPDGLTLASLGGEAGYATLGSQGGWRRLITAEVTVERILLALNDRPVSLYALGRYDNPGDGLRGEIGLRFALFTRTRTQ